MAFLDLNKPVNNEIMKCTHYLLYNQSRAYDNDIPIEITLDDDDEDGQSTSFDQVSKTILKIHKVFNLSRGEICVANFIPPCDWGKLG